MKLDRILQQTPQVPLKSLKDSSHLAFSRPKMGNSKASSKWVKSDTALFDQNKFKYFTPEIMYDNVSVSSISTDEEERELGF